MTEDKKNLPWGLTEEQFGKTIEAQGFPKVTKNYIESRIVGWEVINLASIGNPTVTICSITLDNGYSVRGESACVDPRNYDKEIGEKLAYQNAFNKLWPLFGFLLAEAIYKDKQAFTKAK